MRLASCLPSYLSALSIFFIMKARCSHAMTYRYFTRRLRPQTAMETHCHISAVDYGIFDVIHIHITPENILVSGRRRRKSPSSSFQDKHFQSFALVLSEHSLQNRDASSLSEE